MVINPYVLYMKKNLTIYRLSTPSMTLIAQSKAEKRGTLLLLSSFGHPVVWAHKIDPKVPLTNLEKVLENTL